MSEFDESVQLAHVWINALHEKTGWADKHRSWRLLRATLQAVRDHLPVNEAADLGSQLPMLIRGAYYEGWRPAATPSKDRSREGFVAEVQTAFRPDPMGDAEEAIGAVFALLEERVSAGEMQDVRGCLPAHIRELMPG
jgi:uncharacterized protein (DUF2267 family)